MVGVQAGELELAGRACPIGVAVGRRQLLLGIGAVVLGRDHLVLQPVDPGDEAGEQRRRVAADLVFAEGEVVDALQQERQAVGGRDGREEGIHTGLERLVVEQPQAERAERLHMKLLIGSIELRLQALAHLGGGGCREGQREDALGGHTLAHEPHEAAHHGLRLSGARSGSDDQWAVGMGDGRLLRAVQAVEGYRHRGLGYAAACPFPTAPIGLASASRAAGANARDAVHGYANTAERGVETGRGEGGDTAYVIDRAAEDAIFAEIEGLGVPLMAVSEERGELDIGEGGPVRVVVDPVDGSLNAKRGLPFACVSIAIASGPRMSDVEIGWVAELDPRISMGDEPRAGRDWWAVKGEGAFRDGERPCPRCSPARSRSLGSRPRARSWWRRTSAIESVGARRIRALGSVAMTLCLVAGQLDAMLSLRPIRSVDAAAAQLLVTEAGGAVLFPTDDALTLEMRSPVLAARDGDLLERLRNTFAS